MNIFGNETTVSRVAGTVVSIVIGGLLASSGPDFFPWLGPFAAWPGIALAGAGIIRFLPPEPGKEGRE